MSRLHYCLVGLNEFIIIFCAFGNVKGLDGGFRQVALELHNEYRSHVNSAPLQLDSQLNIAAHAHAEKLAVDKSFEPSDSAYGHQENLWVHFGELRPLNMGTRDATKTWYLVKPFPPNGTIYSINPIVLYSNTTSFLGIGVGTTEGYTAVVAYYL